MPPHPRVNGILFYKRLFHRTKEGPHTMRTRNFRLFWFSEFIGTITGAAAGFAFPLVVFRETGSLTMTGTIITLESIFALVFGVLGGSSADKWDRKRQILVCETMGALACLALAWLLKGDGINVLAFAAVSCAGAAAQAFSMANSGAALPQLVSSQDLPQAQGFMQARMQIGGLLGPFLGGFLLELGHWVPFAMAALGSLLTVALVAPINVSLNPAERATGNLLTTTIEGFRLSLRNSYLNRAIVKMALGNSTINGALFLAVIALEVSGYSNLVIGTARTAIGLIGILGSLATGYLQRRFSFAQLQILSATWAVAMLIFMTIAATLGSVLLVVPLGAAMIFAPASTALVYARMADIIPPEAFGRASTIATRISIGAAGLWTSPLSAIGGALSLVAVLWVNTAVAALTIGQSFLLNRAEARATENRAPANTGPGDTAGD